MKKERITILACCRLIYNLVYMKEKYEIIHVIHIMKKRREKERKRKTKAKNISIVSESPSIEANMNEC